MKFRDLLVVETTVGIAGPLAGRYLSDLGATVLKVESAARPDNNRRRVPPPGMTADQAKDVLNVHEMNGGKRSVSMNLKTEAGRDALLALLDQADVYIENFAPGWLGRLGLSHAQLLARNPRLVIASQSAYGEEGPLSDRRAYAPVMTALAGVESVVGYEDGRVVPQMAGAVGDVVAANYALVGLLAALYERDRTGVGAHLDMSQIEASAAIAGVAFAENGLAGEPPTPRGNTDPRYAPHGVYRTAGDDSWVALAAYTDGEWLTLCRVLGISEVDSERFSVSCERLQHRDDVDRIVAQQLLSEERDEIYRRLQAAGVACVPLLDCYEAESLAEFVDRGLWVEVPHPNAGTLRLTAPPWHFDSMAAAPKGHFEPTGAGTRHVMAELLRWSDAKIEESQRDGAFT